jgi:hypothetical protein
MSPEELQLRMIRFESYAGASEGRQTYDSGQMRNIGARPDDLDGDDVVDEHAGGAGVVRYERTKVGWVVSFQEQE